MSEGTIKWFNDTKGYGFIARDGQDVFVHFSVIEMDGYRTLQKGDLVEYEVEDGSKGLHATKVVKKD
ncbi:cold-shock protein [candidate division KSB1 bacterium RBG_16_48_16]|nr:MAG: cold-shock protein [candidate division KSB1 bacterium RBG_16_48_16]